MTRLPALLASYAGYHRNPLNKATHFVGVPMIVFAIMIPMSLTRVPALGDWPVLALGAAGLSVLWYLSLDLVLGLALGVIYALLLLGADAIARQGGTTAWTAFGVLFTIGWAFQLLGHRLEGNRPALLDNLLQTLVAPIFLAAEAGFALGWGKGLQAEIERVGPSRTA